MSALYLQKKIIEVTRKPIDPRPYMTRAGYTKLCGAPTDIMIRLDGEKIWRRLYAWQFSNSPTTFLRIKGECRIVRDVQRGF